MKLEPLILLILGLTLVDAQTEPVPQLQASTIAPIVIEQQPGTSANSCPSEILVNQARNEIDYNVRMLLTDTILPTYLGTLESFPAASCKDINPDFPSGYYWIRTPNIPRGVSQQYCDQDRTCSCDGTGGWMRVADIDMSDPMQQCPPEFRFLTTPRRSCGKPTRSCTSTTFQSFGVEYSRVCGRVNAYQVGTTDAFLNEEDTIDDGYIDGVSLTYNNMTGSRQHIWTFAAGHDDTTSDPLSLENTCPCTHSDIEYQGSLPPSFVGNDYFCETGVHGQRASENVPYPDDPLWDGQGCQGTSTCCSFNNPPWFCQQLAQPTTSDIEMRICHSASGEDTPIELVEIYVQ